MKPTPATLPSVIESDGHLTAALQEIDCLMQIDHPSQDQAVYFETLVELVEAYEAKHHPMNPSAISGLDGLKHILENTQMSASDLARLLGIHPTMGSKILNGSRKLTWDHAKLLATHFNLEPAFFMD